MAQNGENGESGEDWREGVGDGDDHGIPVDVVAETVVGCKHNNRTEANA